MYLLIYYHQNHLCLKDNISNSSTPGFKAMKLQDHLKIIYIIQILKMNYYSKKCQPFCNKKDCRCWRKANGNNVGSQGQPRQLASNENMIDYRQFTMQSLTEYYEIVGGFI